MNMVIPSANYIIYAYSISAYFPAFAGFSPRMTDLLTAGTEICSCGPYGWLHDC